MFPEAQDCAAVHWQVRDILPVEEDAAAVGLHQPHDRIEARGLARAVRPEQADNFPAMNVERNVMKHRPTVVGLGDRAHLEPAKLRPNVVGGSRKSRGFVHLA